MWLHIRGVGEWTNRLYSYFEEEQHKLQSLNEQLPGSVTSSAVDPAAESSKMKKLQTYGDLTAVVIIIIIIYVARRHGNDQDRI